MNLKKIVTIAASAFVLSLPVSAQDLLARQAPVDKKMRAVDTLALKTVIAREEIETPSANLYGESWNTNVAHQSATLPETFKIDLRDFHMPTTSRVITSKMGPRWGRQHRGLDIKVYIGDTIRAAFSGKVRVKKYEAAGYGKYLVLRHPNGLETVYGHMSEWLVEQNQTVKAGQPIGLGGNTGRSTGSHLHFETRLCGVALNPALMFDFVNQDVTGDYYVFRRSSYEHENAAINNNMPMRASSGTSTTVRRETTQTVTTSAPTTTTSVAVVSTPQKVTIPATNEARYHKVAAGETLSSIAQRRGLTVDQLCKLNNLTRDVKVRPGQLLRYS